jgi:hypothetical protein
MAAQNDDPGKLQKKNMTKHTKRIVPKSGQVTTQSKLLEAAQHRERDEWELEQPRIIDATPKPGPKVIQTLPPTANEANTKNRSGSKESFNHIHDYPSRPKSTKQDATTQTTPPQPKSRSII